MRRVDGNMMNEADTRANLKAYKMSMEGVIDNVPVEMLDENQDYLTARLILTLVNNKTTGTNCSDGS